MAAGALQDLAEIHKDERIKKVQINLEKLIKKKQQNKWPRKQEYQR